MGAAGILNALQFERKSVFKVKTGVYFNANFAQSNWESLKDVLMKIDAWRIVDGNTGSAALTSASLERRSYWRFLIISLAYTKSFLKMKHLKLEITVSGTK